jgi:hypothetical protein
MAHQIPGGNKMKPIGYADDLVPLILSGQKTLTYRLDSRFNEISVGDTVEFRNSQNEKVIGKLKIISIEKTTFGKLPIDRPGHEKYQSKEEQREIFKSYYGDTFTDDSEVTILEHEVVEIYG